VARLEFEAHGVADREFRRWQEHTRRPRRMARIIVGVAAVAAMIYGITQYAVQPRPPRAGSPSSGGGQVR